MLATEILARIALARQPLSQMPSAFDNAIRAPSTHGHAWQYMVHDVRQRSGVTAVAQSSMARSVLLLSRRAVIL
jgi:hypothetical protein